MYISIGISRFSISRFSKVNFRGIFILTTVNVLVATVKIGVDIFSHSQFKADLSISENEVY